MYTLYWGFKKILCIACLLFNCFLVMKGILKALFSFIPWLLNLSDLPNYGLNWRKRYTLRLFSKCLGRSTLCLSGGKRFLRFPLVITSYYKKMQNLYKNWLLVSKIILGIWITSDKQWKFQKVEIQWATFAQKNTFLQLKHFYTEDLSNITFNYLCES